jgi:hypothetical protein
MEIHTKTNLQFKRTTQMAHTHTSKPPISPSSSALPPTSGPLPALGVIVSDLPSLSLTMSYTLIGCVFPPLPPAILSWHQSPLRRMRYMVCHDYAVIKLNYLFDSLNKIGLVNRLDA